MAEVEKPKSNRGGYRPGSGRKPMKIESDVRSAIEAALAGDPGILRRMWKTFAEKAERGSVGHAKLLCAYYYGLPIENVNVSTKQMILKRIIVDVNADPTT